MISLSYRELWILRWLYEDMSTSDHDLRYSMELLDRHRQRLATEEAARLTTAAIGTVHQDMCVGFQGIYSQIDETNSELHTMRIEQKIAAGVQIFQGFLANKDLKNIRKHFGI